jgi:hypothetical protein
MSVADPQDTRALLGGARRVRTRVRGFAPWAARGTTLELLEQVRGVLGEYEDYLPLTIRQIFYRLVGAHNYEKTEQAYARLCEHLNRARRARLIDMAAIRDGGGDQRRPQSWSGAEQFLEITRWRAERLRLDRSVGQTTRLAVLCEAAGMVAQLANIALDYGVPVFSSGGFESVTEKHGFAAEIAADPRSLEVLHIGDHDPSGAHLFLALSEDVKAFAVDLGGAVTFTRLAVTPEQVSALRLPTAPAKPTDDRAFVGATCQAEAIAPDVLADIVCNAIEGRIDRAAYERVLKRERKVQRELARRLR